MSVESLWRFGGLDLENLRFGAPRARFLELWVADPTSHGSLNAVWGGGGEGDPRFWAQLSVSPACPALFFDKASGSFSKDFLQNGLRVYSRHTVFQPPNQSPRPQRVDRSGFKDLTIKLRLLQISAETQEKSHNSKLPRILALDSPDFYIGRVSTIGGSGFSQLVASMPPSDPCDHFWRCFLGRFEYRGPCFEL